MVYHLKYPYRIIIFLNIKVTIILVLQIFICCARVARSNLSSAALESSTMEDEYSDAHFDAFDIILQPWWFTKPTQPMQPITSNGNCKIRASIVSINLCLKYFQSLLYIK